MCTPLFSMPRCKGSSPRAISPRCFALPPSGSGLGMRSIPRDSASTSARSSDLSMPVRKLKSLSNAAGVANSFLLRYSAGSRMPEHCDHSLWRLEQASEHVRLAHRGHLYFCLFSWLLSHHSISFVPDPLPFLHVTDSLTALLPVALRIDIPNCAQLRERQLSELDFLVHLSLINSILSFLVSAALAVRLCSFIFAVAVLFLLEAQKKSR